MTVKTFCKFVKIWLRCDQISRRNFFGVTMWA